MLNPDQADKISGVILSISEAERLANMNARAKRVPMYYRVPELVGLEPWMCAELVENARKNVARKPLFTAVWLLTCAAMLVGGICAYAFAWQLKLVTMLFVVCAVIVWAPLACYRNHLVRRVVRENAKVFKAGSYEAGAIWI